MERFIKAWVILITTVFVMLFISGLETGYAQQYFTYVGKVVSLHGESLSVKGAKGDVMYFAIGRRTKYIPSRLPGVGERVEVSYYLKRGHNVAYQVKILP